MKRKLPLLALGLLTGLAAGYFFLRHPSPPAPAEAALPPPFVPIEDGKTIDFSGGRAEVRDTPEDRAAMEHALREMEAAAKDITFGPIRSPSSPPPP
jgi:hypothetical protein